MRESIILLQFTVIRRFHVNRILYYKEDYDRLGLGPDAGEKEIKDAYVRLAKKFHPDSSGRSDGLEFQQTTESYRRLLKDVQQGRNNFNRSESKRNSSSEPGWYGWDKQQSYHSKPMVLARKINMAFRVIVLTILLLTMLKNIIRNK